MLGHGFKNGFTRDVLHHDINVFKAADGIMGQAFNHDLIGVVLIAVLWVLKIRHRQEFDLAIAVDGEEIVIRHPFRQAEFPEIEPAVNGCNRLVTRIIFMDCGNVRGRRIGDDRFQCNQRNPA